MTKIMTNWLKKNVLNKSSGQSSCSSFNLSCVLSSDYRMNSFQQMWAMHFVQFHVSPAPLILSLKFPHCTASQPGTGCGDECQPTTHHLLDPARCSRFCSRTGKWSVRRLWGDWSCPRGSTAWTVSTPTVTTLTSDLLWLWSQFWLCKTGGVSI